MWKLSLRKAADKTVARALEKERSQLRRALEEMQTNPLTGDVLPLTKERAAFRRRVGHWRIFFDLYPEQQLVDVVAIERRTSTTYRRR
jgi:mRNA-degrading endonuclease RelE of RelBE toxin-antitoxin system